METIFTYQPTEKELEELNPSYTGIDEKAYLLQLDVTAKNNGTSQDYERVVDLEELFRIRRDIQRMNYYSHLLDTEFSGITNRLFGE